jgi:hypothetical protein
MAAVNIRVVCFGRPRSNSGAGGEFGCTPDIILTRANSLSCNKELRYSPGKKARQYWRPQWQRDVWYPACREWNGLRLLGDGRTGRRHHFSHVVMHAKFFFGADDLDVGSATSDTMTVGRVWVENGSAIGSGRSVDRSGWVHGKSSVTFQIQDHQGQRA